MSGKENFLTSKAFNSLEPQKKQLISDFLNKENPDIGDIVTFTDKLNKGTPLTAEQQKQLFSALTDSLSEADRRKAANILEIIKAFS